MESPHWRSEAQLKDMRAFRMAALKMLDCPNRLVRFKRKGQLSLSRCKTGMMRRGASGFIILKGQPLSRNTNSQTLQL